MFPEKIGFMGLGLIGGSIAKTIHRVHPSISLYAFDLNEESIAQALEEKLIAGVLNPDTILDLDMLFLCAPVHTNIEFLEKIKTALPLHCLITDVGSVKGNIHRAIHTLGLTSQFIGGHPMAGSEKSGFSSSTAYLIENAYYILTPTADVDRQKVQAYRDFVGTLGAIPLVLEPDCHDYVTASVSHIPHIIAASLVNMVKHLDSSDETMKAIAAGGFKDITRIASSSPVMWQQICLTNKEQILQVLSSFKEQIGTIEQEIQAGDAEGLYNFFDTSKNYRDSISNRDRGPLKSIYYLYCDLIDEAGGIANIAQILAIHHISIRNIGIINNREFEEGVLRIEFYDENSVTLAVELLEKYHYTVHRMHK